MPKTKPPFAAEFPAALVDLVRAGRTPKDLTREFEPSYGRVGFRITHFEACSAFTRVAARVVVEPPKAGLRHRGASGDVVTSIVRPDCYRLERQVPGGIRTR